MRSASMLARIGALALLSLPGALGECAVGDLVESHFSGPGVNRARATIDRQVGNYFIMRWTHEPALCQDQESAYFGTNPCYQCIALCRRSATELHKINTQTNVLEPCSSGSGEARSNFVNAAGDNSTLVTIMYVIIAVVATTLVVWCCVQVRVKQSKKGRSRHDQSRFISRGFTFDWERALSPKGKKTKISPEMGLDATFDSKAVDVNVVGDKEYKRRGSERHWSMKAQPTQTSLDHAPTIPRAESSPRPSPRQVSRQSTPRMEPVATPRTSMVVKTSPRSVQPDEYTPRATPRSARSNSSDQAHRGSKPTTEQVRFGARAGNAPQAMGRRQSLEVPRMEKMAFEGSPRSTVSGGTTRASDVSQPSPRQ